MYQGRLVEQGEASRVLSTPYHPYTEALLSAVPDPDPRAHPRRVRLQGQHSSGGDETSGCPFEPRCRRSLGDICRTEEPPWRYGAVSAAVPAAPPGGAPHAIRCHIAYEELRTQQDAEPGEPGAGQEAGS
jgi:peptide/nickel transport system ATP-binding protein